MNKVQTKRIHDVGEKAIEVQRMWKESKTWMQNGEVVFQVEREIEISDKMQHEEDKKKI